jgi:hypothetical protein
MVDVTDAANRLRLRYPRSRLPRPLPAILVAVVAAVALGWLLWAALAHSTPAVSARVTAFQVVSDDRIDVVMTVDRPDPRIPATCLVVAQAPDFERVAEQNVAVAATAERLVDVRISLTTLRRATSASVKGCNQAG